MKGTLIGIGMGPGDPELLTLKALGALKRCDVIAVPDSGREESAAYLIAWTAWPRIERKPSLAVPMPMTHDLGKLRESHRAAADAIEAQLDAGRNVGFVTLGDPTVYSTYMYVHALVAGDGYATEIVSGVTSFCAAAAQLGMSLGERAQMIHIVPSSHGVAEALKLPGVKILMKAGSRMAEVKASLLASGQAAVMVENCGMPNERVYRGAAEIPDRSGYFSVIIVKGEGGQS